MIERANQPIMLELEGGLTIRLSYSMKTLREIRDKLGVSILKGQGLDVDEDKLPAMIHYGAREYHPEITLEQIDASITGPNMRYYLHRLFLAMTGVDVYPELEKNGAASPPMPSLPN